MDLDDLTGTASKAFAIGGKDYLFGELPLEAEGHLQAWIKKNHPHPVEALKPHLAGLAAEDRAELLDRARKEARNWPPQVGTQAGAVALLSTQAGQEETLYHALRVHQPETTRDDARRLYRRLTKDALAFSRRQDALEKAAGEAGAPFTRAEFDTVQRLFAVAFGMDDDDAGGDGGDAPKAG